MTETRLLNLSDNKSKEKTAFIRQPINWLRDSYIQNGRGLLGLCYLSGDLNLPATDHDPLLKAVGLVSAPATMLFIAEPILGKYFPQDEKERPLVTIAGMTINTTKLAYRIVGTSCALLAYNG